MSGELKPEYLLVKRGLYYRPDNHGYTGLKREAGRYFQNDAYEGVLAVHEDEAGEYAPSCWLETQLADKDAQISTLLTAVKDMGEALETFADCCDQISEDEDDEEWAKFRLLIKDYRKARATLAKYQHLMENVK